MYNNYKFDLRVLKIKHRKQSNNSHSSNQHTKYSKTGRQTYRNVLISAHFFQTVHTVLKVYA